MSRGISSEPSLNDYRRALLTSIRAGSRSVLESLLSGISADLRPCLVSQILPSTEAGAGLTPAQYSLTVRVNQRGDRAEILNCLLHHGAEMIQASGWQLMTLACRLGSSTCVEVILNHGCNVTRSIPLCLDAIVDSGSPALQCLLLLLAKGADVTEEAQILEDTYLSYAVKLAIRSPYLHYNVINQLLRGGAISAVNYPDNDGKTPLMLARTSGIAELLMNARTCLFTQDLSGKTAFDFAVEARLWGVADVISKRIKAANRVQKLTRARSGGRAACTR